MFLRKAEFFPLRRAEYDRIGRSPHDLADRVVDRAELHQTGRFDFEQLFPRQSAGHVVYAEPVQQIAHAPEIVPHGMAVDILP